MVKSMYAAVAGLRTHQSKMDILSNNIANVNTPGYKSANITFMDTMYQNTSTGSTGSATDGGTGGTNTNQVGYGVKVGDVSYDFSTGGKSTSSSGLDCMIDSDNAFFIVGPMKTSGVSLSDDDAIKSSGLYLSRVGNFKVDGNGYLTDSSGQYVYGYKNSNAADPSQDASYDTDNLSTIQIPTDSATGDLVEFSGYSVQQDGTVVGTGTDDKTYILGKIALANVQNPNGLEKTSGYYFSIGANAGQVSAMVADSEISSNYLELSNVDLATQMTDMITTQRGFQANSKIITVTDSMLEELVNMKR